MSQRVSVKIETIVIAVFCFAFLVWAWSKCSDKKTERARHSASEEEQDERPAARQRDTVQVVQPVQPQPVQPQPAQPQTVGGHVVARPGSQTGQPSAPQTASNSAAAAPAKPAVPTAEKRTVLYSTIDGLKVRKEPGLKSTTVDKLKLHEEVYFLSQKTDWEEELSLSAGQPAVKDHWVKIRTKRGKEGWVFGAGVHYYKVAK